MQQLRWEFNAASRRKKRIVQHVDLVSSLGDLKHQLRRFLRGFWGLPSALPQHLNNPAVAHAAHFLSLFKTAPHHLARNKHWGTLVQGTTTSITSSSSKARCLAQPGAAFLNAFPPSHRQSGSSIPKRFAALWLCGSLGLRL